jgi:excisionase family DNA binding protein
MIKQQYISTNELLVLTGLSRSTVERAKARNELQYYKKGTRCLYKIDEVKNWIED